MSISCKLVGRTANQMCQMAAAIAHAKRMKTDYIFPKKTQNPAAWPRAFPTILPGAIMPLSHLTVWNQPDFTFTPIPEQNNLMLNGYFQSYKYFDDAKDEILEAFKMKCKLTEDGELPVMDAVSIHVRRGDYLQYPDKHPVCTMEYFNQAIELFPDDQFIVFSDDLSWCHQNFKGDRFRFAHGSNEYQDLGAMKLCKANIISNSSFSWMAAYLNEFDQKKVVSPSADNWFGIGNKSLDTKDLLPPDWIQIKF